MVTIITERTATNLTLDSRHYDIINNTYFCSVNKQLPRPLLQQEL